MRCVTIIPAPSSFLLKGGDVYAGSGFSVTCSDNTDRSLVRLHVEEVLGRLAQHPEANALTLTIDVTQAAAPDGGYQLTVEGRGITIRTGSTAAVRYALDSLRQLHRHFGDHMPCLEIVDEPRFDWRGMHLDCARHFMPVDFVLKFLDLLALHRMNVFHWHLTDDQGWRLEIPSRPLLIERGSSRGDGERRHEGWYSSDDVKRVLERAAALGITVIPEIDVPGHCTAALYAYPELACFSPPTHIPDPPSGYGVLCASRTSTFDFLSDVFGTVADLFPSRRIHVGGDEVGDEPWDNCPDCRVTAAGRGLPGRALQTVFTQFLQTLLASADRELIGWEEILDSAVRPPATAMVWRMTGREAEALQRGLDVIVCRNDVTYFDSLLSKIAARVE